MPSPGTHPTGVASGDGASAHPNSTTTSATEPSTLFAALNYLDGKLIARTEVPPHPCGMVTVPQADRPGNTQTAGTAPDHRQLRHAQAREGTGVVGEASPIPLALHADRFVLAQPGGTLLWRTDARMSSGTAVSPVVGELVRHRELPDRKKPKSQALPMESQGRRHSAQDPACPTGLGWLEGKAIVSIT